MSIKICGVTTRPGTAKIMFNNFKHVSKNGYECSIICQPNEEFQDVDIDWGRFIPVEMNRGNVSPMEVAKSIYKLYKIFKKEKFDVIQYASSNASLYASIAGWLARVPIRIFCQWGIPYLDYSGFKRMFFKYLEYLTCRLSTSVQPDSLTNLDFAIKERLYGKEKGSILGMGSAQGVSLSRFSIDKKSLWRNEIRTKYGVGDDVVTFCFVGRIVPQKGINELLEAFLKLRSSKVALFIVGAPDEIDMLKQDLLTKAKDTLNIIFTGAVSDPEKYHAAADFFVLPSYREGFPNTILEAGALGVPSIVTNINGMIDLIEDARTGFLCDVKSVHSLYSCMSKAITMKKKDYHQMSVNIYEKVKRFFDSEYIQYEFLKDRNRLYQQISR